MDVLILDDNEEFADQLKKDLFKHFSKLWDQIIFDVYTKNFSQLHLMQNYDMAFFDIDLKDENGISLAKELKNKGLCKTVIFVSAHAHLVYESLAIRPYFFVRKGEYKQDLKILFSLLDASFKEKTLLTLQYQGIKQDIHLEDIIYIEIVNHVLHIHTLNQEYKDSRLIGDFLKETKATNLIQIHKSFAINVDYLLSYSSTEVNLPGQISICIDRFYKKQFIKKYQEYLLQ